jgi:mannosyltransferase
VDTRGPAPTDRAVCRARAVAPFWGLLVITALAALLRFWGIGHQGFWYDESLTVRETNMSFRGMLAFVSHVETTPPLYFALVWLWAKVAGFGEAGLRSLSALVGITAVPIAYFAGRRLVSSRIGLLASGLVALNPLLVWYSQEARSYSLFATLGAASFASFVYVVRGPTNRGLALWALTSALAVATHFFAGFLVAPEALWLLSGSSRSRATWMAVGAVAATQLAVLRMAIGQRTVGTRWIHTAPLLHRLGQIPKQFLSGTGSWAEPWVLAGTGLCVMGALVLVLVRGGRDERGGAGIALAVGLCAIVLPLLLALGGLDYLLTRNVIMALVPLLIALACGLAARHAGRVGIAVAVAICALSLVPIAAVGMEARLQRPSWRTLVDALGRVTQPRAVEVAGGYRAQPLKLYLSHVSYLGRRSAFLRELDFVGFHPPSGSGCWWGSACELPDAIPRRSSPLRGFSIAGRRKVGIFEFVRLRSTSPRLVRARLLPARVVFPRWHPRRALTEDRRRHRNAGAGALLFLQRP